MNRMTAAEYQAMLAAPKKNGDKYRGKRTELDGQVFSSGGEAKRYAVLKQMEHAGMIRNLTTQVKYSMDLNGIHICTYTADFVYERLVVEGALGKAWQHVVEDYKSDGTAGQRDWPRTKKLMLAFHGITIYESGRKK